MPNITRRNFLKLATYGAGAGLCLTAGSAYAVRKLDNTTEEVRLKIDRIKIPELHDNFVGFKIGFLSDIHLGPFVSNELLYQAINLLNEKSPDILILGGDHLHIPNSSFSKIFNYIRNEEFPNRYEKNIARRILNRFCDIFQTAKTKHGILAIPGNHDNSNAKNIIKPIFNKHGINYLINKSYLIKNGSAQLEFFAVDDYWTGVPIKTPALENKKITRILLAHNPDYISNLLKLNQHSFDLALAGHTHAGQICLQQSTPIVANINDTRLAYGHLKFEEQQIIVTAGIGVVEIPLRLNCPAEANLIVLDK
jgi:predicted MPP superfamily phosphohydrolase